MAEGEKRLDDEDGDSMFDFDALIFIILFSCADQLQVLSLFIGSMKEQKRKRRKKKQKTNKKN